MKPPATYSAIITLWQRQYNKSIKAIQVIKSLRVHQGSSLKHPHAPVQLLMCPSYNQRVRSPPPKKKQYGVCNSHASLHKVQTSRPAN